jgi:hypothetical protein
VIQSKIQEEYLGSEKLVENEDDPSLIIVVVVNIAMILWKNKTGFIGFPAGLKTPENIGNVCQMLASRANDGFFYFFSHQLQVSQETFGSSVMVIGYVAKWLEIYRFVLYRRS